VKEISPYWTTVPFLLVVVISAAYVAIGLGTADGRAVAPLDDAYITYQYARQIAQGQLYQYNDGDPATTGMTSPLFGFLLAGVHWIGLAGERLVASAVVAGAIWLGLIGWLTYRLARHLTESLGWALFGATLTILTGSLQWGCFNGMETGLFTVLTLAALHAFFTEKHGLCALWLGLAALTRTEGLILTGLVWAASAAGGFLDDGDDRWRGPRVLSAALAAGFIPSVVNWALTGDPSAAGLRAKSWFLNVPFYPGNIIGSILRSYQRIIIGSFLMGREGVVIPGLLLLSLVGWVTLGVQRRWKALSVTLSWFLVGTLSAATLITATWHVGRYQVPFVPIVVVLGTCGLAALEKRLRGTWKPIIMGAASLFLVVTSATSTVQAQRLYRRAVHTVAHQQLPLANWLRENLPPEARVGVHDAGSLRYVSGQSIYDLIGLTTPDAAVAWRHGAGSVYEKMEHSPMRPDYFAIYPDVFSIPYLAKTDLFAEELFRVEVPDYAVASAGPVQGAWRADWHLAGSGESLRQPDVLRRTAGLERVDTLDVADLEDETAHGVAWWQEVKQAGFPTEVWQLPYRVPPHDEVIDGGRLLTGGIAFNASTEPGRDLWIAARLHAQQAGGVDVMIDGQEVGRWAYPRVPGRWLETVFRVPGDRISSQKTRIRLEAETDNPSFRHYSPYTFWLFQGEGAEQTYAIEQPLDVTFGDHLSLLGFNPPQTLRRPGDRLHLTLYWQPTSPTEEDAKVFVHLYDASGRLQSQSDGWAYHGTRPPYTWEPGEVVEDPRTLSLPADLPPGDYSLEVGLYDPSGSGRLPAHRDGVRQPEDRVALTRVEVVE